MFRRFFGMEISGGIEQFKKYNLTLQKRSNKVINLISYLQQVCSFNTFNKEYIDLEILADLTVIREHLCCYRLLYRIPM